MTDVQCWHASPRRGGNPAAPSHQRDTGEIRIPLSLFDLDAHQGDVELVLSRAEGEAMYAALARFLYGSYTAR